MEEPLHGQRIGAYRIIRQLGAGGMGEVYEAEHVALGVRRALKVFSTESEHVEFLRKRFIDEGRILAAFQHPRIVRVYNLVVDEESGKAYFEMDLVLSPTGQPRTLADELQDGVSEEDVVGWFKDICEGLAYIHSQGVVHRDISLDNILIGPDGRAVITDFGIAKIIDDSFRKRIDMTVTVVSKDGSELRMGKGLYMAPELKKGGKVTYASDAYAVGVILFRLLTGAWYAPTTKLDLLPDFEYDWVPVISRLCNVDPEKRLGEGGIAALPSLLRRVDVDMEESSPLQAEHVLQPGIADSEGESRERKIRTVSKTLRNRMGDGNVEKGINAEVFHDLFRYLYLIFSIVTVGVLPVGTVLFLWVRYLDLKTAIRRTIGLLLGWRAVVGLLSLIPMDILPAEVGNIVWLWVSSILFLNLNLALKNIKKNNAGECVAWRIFSFVQWIEIIVIGAYPLVGCVLTTFGNYKMQGGKPEQILLGFTMLFFIPIFSIWRTILRSLMFNKIRWAYRVEMVLLCMPFLSFLFCVLHLTCRFIGFTGSQSDEIATLVQSSLNMCVFYFLSPLSPISFCMGLLKCVRERFVEGSGHLSARSDLALRIFYIGSVFIFYVVFILFVVRNFVAR